MALKKSQLYNSLWQSCDELRGGMDASQYKDYALTLLFMKYVSDRKNSPDSLIEVPDGGSFQDMVALKGDKEIGDKINKVIGRLAEANDLKGVIDQADFNDETRLGAGKDMQDRLSKLVSIFDQLDLGANRPDGDDLLGDAYEYLMRQESPTLHPYIRVADLRPGGVDGTNIRFVPEKAFPAIQNYRIYKDDLFISVAGTLGMVGTIPSYLDGANLTENADRITDIKCNRYYLMYWLISEPVQRTIESIRTVGAQPKLALGRIAKFKIAIPANAGEQRAIATALSDADALIESLDRLIAKKRAIKQAAMQQLLTGQTRLPGFIGEWETKRLGDLLTIRYGRNQSDIEKYDGKYPILATGGEIGRTDTPLYKSPSVLIGRKGTIDEPRYMDSPFWTVDTLFCTEIHQDADAKFLFYIFTRIPWREYNEASGVPSLNGKTIEKIQVLVANLEEQGAIATVLSDMDTEIEALERRRDKARQIKQGMMQQLLSGRVRLVAPEVAA